MLQKVLKELKEKEFTIETMEQILDQQEKKVFTDIIYPKAAYFSTSYIEVQSIRLNFYKRLSSAKNLEEIKKLQQEIIDRFGKPDLQGERLIKISEIKYFAEQIGIKRISYKNAEIKIEFDENNILEEDSAKIFEIITKIMNEMNISYKFVPDKNLTIILTSNSENELTHTKQFLLLLQRKFNLSMN
jgi:transcription-repair coupling factor (superfamily II helicase)